MSVRGAARVTCLVVAINCVAACNSGRFSLDGFPGLSIEATCRTASMTAQYSEVAPAYPGERVAGDLLQPTYLGGTGELPLVCIDHGAETYRIRQHSVGAYRGTILIVGISRSTASARVWVIEQRSVRLETRLIAMGGPSERRMARYRHSVI